MAKKKKIKDKLTIPKGLPFGIQSQPFSNIYAGDVRWTKGVPGLEWAANEEQGVNVSGINLSKNFNLGKNLNLNLSNPAFVYAKPMINNKGYGHSFKPLPFQPKVSLTYNFENGGPPFNPTISPLQMDGPPYETETTEGLSEDAMSGIMKARIAYDVMHGNPGARRLVKKGIGEGSVIGTREDYLDIEKDVKKFADKYVTSDHHRKLLEKYNYPEDKIHWRIQDILNYNPDRDTRFSLSGSSFVGGAGEQFPLKEGQQQDQPIVQYNLFNPHSFPIEQVISHEWGHIPVSSGFNPLSEEERNEFISRLKPGAVRNEHDAAPQENRADQFNLRYFLDKEGIYDSSTGEEFTQKHLDAYREKTGNRHHRIFRLYNDKDIIWLMNNIAQEVPQQANPNQPQIAEYGSYLYDNGGPTVFHNGGKGPGHPHTNQTRVTYNNQDYVWDKSAEQMQSEFEAKVAGYKNVDGRQIPIDADGNIIKDTDWQRYQYYKHYSDQQSEAEQQRIEDEKNYTWEKNLDTEAYFEDKGINPNTGKPYTVKELRALKESGNLLPYTYFKPEVEGQNYVMLPDQYDYNKIINRNELYPLDDQPAHFFEGDKIDDNVKYYGDYDWRKEYKDNPLKPHVINKDGVPIPTEVQKEDEYERVFQYGNLPEFEIEAQNPLKEADKEKTKKRDEWIKNKINELSADNKNWDGLDWSTKELLLDYWMPSELSNIDKTASAWSSNNPMIRGALGELYHGKGYWDNLGEELTNTIVKPGMAVAALPLAFEALPAAYKLLNKDLLTKGTSVMDVLGYYGAYQGAKNLPEHTSDFVENPSWSGAGNIGLDLLGIAGGASSAYKGFTGLKDTRLGQNVYKINPWANNLSKNVQQNNLYTRQIFGDDALESFKQQGFWENPIAELSKQALSPTSKNIIGGTDEVAETIATTTNRTRDVFNQPYFSQGKLWYGQPGKNRPFFGKRSKLDKSQYDFELSNFDEGTKGYTIVADPNKVTSNINQFGDKIMFNLATENSLISNTGSLSDEAVNLLTKGDLGHIAGTRRIPVPSHVSNNPLNYNVYEGAPHWLWGNRILDEAGNPITPSLLKGFQSKGFLTPNTPASSGAGTLNMGFNPANWFGKTPKTFSTRSVDDVASSSFDPSKSLISKTSTSELDELTRLNVPRNAAYFSQGFPGREALIKKSGFTQYDDVISDLTTTYQNNPILNEAGFPVYFHGSRSGSLPNILKNQGMEGFNVLRGKGITPITGEQSSLFFPNHINNEAISAAYINNLRGALNYAGVTSPRRSFNYADKIKRWKGDWFGLKKGSIKKNLEEIGPRGTSAMGRYSSYYDDLAKTWKKLSTEEKAIINENFPVLFGLNPKGSKGFKDRFVTGFDSSISDEVGILGKTSLDEFEGVFVPQNYINLTQKMFGDKAKVLPIEPLVNSYFPGQKWQWKNGGHLYPSGPYYPYKGDTLKVDKNYDKTHVQPFAFKNGGNSVLLQVRDKLDRIKAAEKLLNKFKNARYGKV